MFIRNLKLLRYPVQGTGIPIIVCKKKLFISSPGPKVHVNYCHHLASVVCCLSSVNFSHFKLLRNHWAELEPNLAGMFLGWSSTKLLFFVPVGYSIWLPGPIISSDWLKFQRSFFSETNELTEPKL